MSRLLLYKTFPPSILKLQMLFCCVLCIFIFKKILIESQDTSKEIVYVKYFSSDCSRKAVENWNSLLNDDQNSTFQIYFRHATSHRNSSYPFISGDTFRALADHIFDETTEVDKWIDRVGEIGRGDIVFLQSEKEMVERFFMNNTFNRIIHPFVLVTHNSDASVPPKDYFWVLNDQKILAWFTQNPYITHKKLFPVPIGFANTRWPHGNVTAFRKAFCLHRKPFHLRTTLLYVNFQVSTNKKARSQALKWIENFPNIRKQNIVPVEAYLQELGNSKFVLSPPGNGLDCHRTWEAILMGAVPIVLRSLLDPLFINESVLIVDDWNNVTLTHLESLKYDPIPSRSLLAKHWYTRLINAADHN